jgi:hypothetical protein
MASFAGAKGAPLAVDLLEVVDGRVVNGFRFSVLASSAAVALREAVWSNAAVFRRLQAQFGSDDAGSVVKASTALLKTRTVTAAGYAKLLGGTSEAMASSVKRFLAAAANDQGLGARGGAGDEDHGQDILEPRHAAQQARRRADARPPPEVLTQGRSAVVRPASPSRRDPALAMWPRRAPAALSRSAGVDSDPRRASAASFFRPEAVPGLTSPPPARFADR